ncbi:hypothetical protein [Tardiphaga sp.]|uniref:hypothetical protein n=1 Tax=Tardiphaga sp. TaxID=1926292 RepID=UPI0025EAA318|nr:hypothetical protein [Tardiphaga sp.]
MISQTGVTDAARRAEIIYAQARAAIDVRLWRAALGSEKPRNATTTPAVVPPLALTTFINLLTTNADPLPDAAGQSPNILPTVPAAPIDAYAGPTRVVPAAGAANGLGRNAGYSTSIASAADRAGIPRAALASIIDAEAAKNRDGSWQTMSRNTRSTASGLGQFLSGTWKSEAERAGTWLNATARRNGWIGANGQVLPDARATLLDLRNNAEASINATADYASHSLGRLAAAGVAIGTTTSEIAHAAYLGHNLGIADAVRFLRGGLDEVRARRLLDAQIGTSSATRRIAEAGGASAAHQGWLLGFMARHIDASRFFADQ